MLLFEKSLLVGGLGCSLAFTRFSPGGEEADAFNLGLFVKVIDRALMALIESLAAEPTSFLSAIGFSF